MAMKTLFAAILVLHTAMFVSCSDMLESDSSRQVFNPELNAKTDSVFYAFGILQAMQQLADQYVFQGEMRGDLVSTTYYTDNNLRQLANFSATTANKYDSAYVYYRVINNCNYYIAHRDTALYTSASNVVINEYAAVKAIRAWAYLQLARNYGRVPFFTEPLTSISQIDNNNYPELDLAGIVGELAPDLESYTGMAAPSLGGVSIELGSTNWGQTKTAYAQYCFIPVDVVLGELYLENGEYANAARHYVTYLTSVANTLNRRTSRYVAPYQNRRMGPMGLNELPSNFSRGFYAYSWSDIFANRSTYDIITYIPMSVNRMRGTTTNVPLTFGYNYYSTSSAIDSLRVDEIQIAPSDSYTLLSDSTTYYYYNTEQGISESKLGDQRANAIMTQGNGEDSLKVWISKYNAGNIILYRTTTVLLHLAEAFNRLGYYDIAFAILKDGISDVLLENYVTYLSDESKQLLQTTYPLLSAENISKFPSKDNQNSMVICGIHMHGAGCAGDFTTQSYFPGMSPYQLDTVVSVKLGEIARNYQVAVGTTKQDTINAMEDLLCDEYALEFSFEGVRYYDLMRLARHKNEAGLYDANFGSRWMARKLDYKQPIVNLEDKNNWYLPFK